MALQAYQNLPQVLCVGAKLFGFVLQTQGLASGLQKIHQFVNFQQTHKRVEQTFEVTVHQRNQRGLANGHLGALGAVGHVGCRWCCAGGKHQYAHIRQVAQR